MQNIKKIAYLGLGDGALDSSELSVGMKLSWGGSMVMVDELMVLVSPCC
jgi:hypothetical protein